MFIVLGRGSQRSIDMPREGYRVSEHSPTVMSGFVPRVAEHNGFNYLHKRQSRSTGVRRNGLAHGVYRSGRVVDSLGRGHRAQASLVPARQLAAKAAVGLLLSSVHLIKDQMSSSPVPLLI